MAEMRVEPAREADAAQILAVHIAARSTYYRGFVPEKLLAEQNERDSELYRGIIRALDRQVRVARLDGEVIGFLVLGPCYHPEPDPAVTSQLYQIQVHPEFFRQGVGSALHAEAVALWQAAGVRAARLWVWDFNVTARAFYAKYGWREDGRELPAGPRIGEHRQLGYRLDLPGLAAGN
ncbi:MULTISPECIES: GNAT family N-acetyltransferase [Amycolatopsis]|nr:GNAT family N-acetyltransferase [Amycolatopsis sacchari]